MFSFYADRKWLPVGSSAVEFLHPFWGAPEESRRSRTRGRYDRWMQHGPQAAIPAPLASADVAVFPGKWESVVGSKSAVAVAQRFASVAEDAGVPSVVFFWSDDVTPVLLPNATVFRTSLIRSVRQANELAMPAWSEDFLAAHLEGRLQLRSKEAVPTVGFCGFAGSHGTGDRFRGVPGGSTPRACALRNLLQSTYVQTNFVLRWRFRGGTRRGYIRNMVSSDYVLCVRGAGNFSYRLYETLSCGRIPVFVDTDCVLPADDLVDWRRTCVWVDESELDRIGEKVAEFHERLSPSEFIDLQRASRQTWEDHIAPHAFFAELGRHFA